MAKVDWFDKAYEEFVGFDLAVDAEVSPEDSKAVFRSLVNFGLIDYDTQKEFLWEEYGQYFA